MKNILLAAALLTLMCGLMRGQEATSSQTLYFAVLDKGPTTPPWHFVVDDQWTQKVHKKRWATVSVQPGAHKVNFGGKVGQRDKHHKTDLEVSIQPGQSRYFVVEMMVNILNPATLSGTSFNLYELSETDWKYRLQDAKPEQ